MSTPINKIMSSDRLEALMARGMRADRYFPSTGEVLVWQGGKPYGYPLAQLAAMADEGKQKALGRG